MTARTMAAGLALVLALAAAPVQAQPAHGDAQRLEALTALARENGVALYCRHLDHVQDVKAAVTAVVPPLPAYGAAFERGTDRGFLDAGGGRLSCPDRAGMAARVEAAVHRLQKAFADQ